MTYIPGTGEISVKKEEPKEENNVYNVVNIQELKNPKDFESIEIGYNQLKYWMIFAGFFSVIIFILSIFNWRILFLIPLPPYVAYLTWHIRKKVKKYAKHIDAFSN